MTLSTCSAQTNPGSKQEGHLMLKLGHALCSNNKTKYFVLRQYKSLPWVLSECSKNGWAWGILGLRVWGKDLTIVFAQALVCLDCVDQLWNDLYRLLFYNLRPWWDFDEQNSIRYHQNEFWQNTEKQWMNLLLNTFSVLIVFFKSKFFIVTCTG